MAAAATRINIKPFYDRTEVPCEGQAGDLIVLSPLSDGQPDSEPQGSASLWFCTRSHENSENGRAVWKRVDFDVASSCDRPLPRPPQNDPTNIE
jgi:hypothetical protein